MGWVVDVHRSVRKWLRKHPEAEELLDKAVDELKKNPFIGEPYKGKMKGLYKYRIGKLRIVYSIDRVNRIVRIWDIGYRENIYEKY